MSRGARPDRVFDLQRRIERVATSLDRLKTGALVAVTGGGLVLGLVGGGIFWMPVSMAGSLLAFRVVGAWFHFRELQRRQRLQQWDDLKERLVDLEQAALPEGTKRALAAPLVTELTGVRMDRLLGTGSDEVTMPHNNQM